MLFSIKYLKNIYLFLIFKFIFKLYFLKPPLTELSIESTDLVAKLLNTGMIS